MKHKILILLAGLFMPFFGIAQEAATEPQMADTFRSEGKIYVVISVISIIFMCLIGYLVYLDIKLRKLENKN